MDGGLSNWLMLSQTEEDGRVAGEIEGKKVGKQTEKGGRDGWDTWEEYQNNPAANPGSFFIIFQINSFDLKPTPASSRSWRFV